jgi:hypothetical protein
MQVVSKLNMQAFVSYWPLHNVGTPSAIYGACLILNSVVNPDPDADPQGSETFCRIRIRNSRLWIRIRVKSHIKSLALWKIVCFGSDPKLDPKLFTSRIRIRNYFFGSGSKPCGKWDPDPTKIVTDPQHWFWRYWWITPNTVPETYSILVFVLCQYRYLIMRQFLQIDLFRHLLKRDLRFQPLIIRTGTFMDFGYSAKFVVILIFKGS